MSGQVCQAFRPPTTPAAGARSYLELRDAGRWDVEIAGRRYPARVWLRLLYDPENRRIKG